MKATEMLKQVKDLLGIDVKEEVVLSEEVEQKVEATEATVGEKSVELTEEVTKTEVTEETLSEDQVEEKVELATMQLENGTTVEAEAFEAGNEIFIVTEDEKVALPVGNYTLEDSTELIVEEEGIIASIGEPAAEEVEAAADYATKEELAEVKKAVEDIVTMIEEMGYGKKDEKMASEEKEDIKEELSEVEKVKHNPETEEKPETILYAQNRPMGTLDRVFQTISKLN
jgi:hypothetical protein|tara:strand:+ start:14202 stop:14885 length:684 start_codon:yes stop_codon:yes gene_type:complete